MAKNEIVYFRVYVNGMVEIKRKRTLMHQYLVCQMSKRHKWLYARWLRWELTR